MQPGFPVTSNVLRAICCRRLESARLRLITISRVEATFQLTDTLGLGSDHLLEAPHRVYDCGIETPLLSEFRPECTP
jgi:hypothetical protein